MPLNRDLAKRAKALQAQTLRELSKPAAMMLPRDVKQVIFDLTALVVDLSEELLNKCEHRCDVLPGDPAWKLCATCGELIPVERVES